MPTPARKQRLCWVVSDGRRGIENQALGLAEALARLTPLSIERRIAPRRTTLWPREVRLDDLAVPDGEIGEPEDAGRAPDIWISCGRASLPYAERARGWFRGRTYVVQLQDPRRPLPAFDLVVPPQHDGLHGPNVLPIIGSPNRVSADRLAIGSPLLAAALQRPGPRAAVLIGGDSKRHRLSSRMLSSIMFALESARATGWSLLVTTSRRTPESAVAAIRARLADDPAVWLWTGGEADGPNPYDAFLAAADVVLVTKDSTNMITEAATAGKPILLLPMDGVDGKFAGLYQTLVRRGNAKIFAGDLTPWPVEPLRETDRAAAEVLKRIEARALSR